MSHGVSDHQLEWSSDDPAGVIDFANASSSPASCGGAGTRRRPGLVNGPSPLSVPPLGFGSALVGSFGPMVAPFFLARGLVRGAYIGTEAAAVVMQLTKLIVFGAAAVLTVKTAAIGLALAPASAAGAWAGKKIVDRLPHPPVRSPHRGRPDRLRTAPAHHQRLNCVKRGAFDAGH
jgi:hypothetical protein